MEIEPDARTLPAVVRRERLAAWLPGLALIGILALAGVLEFWRLDGEGTANAYYAAAVRSMAADPVAFLFAGFDAGGYITLDKPPLGFQLQAISVAIFGFGGVALLLPQVLATIGSVGLLAAAIRPAWGTRAALVAALALALTPVSVAVGRNNTPDSTLVFAVLAAAWALTRGLRTGHLRWLLVAMALVGAGFEIKMLQAWLVLPAMGAAWFLAARGPLRRRAAGLAVSAVPLAAVSFWWAATVALWPAANRPWIGGSSANSLFELAFDYNGLDRLSGGIAFDDLGTPGPLRVPGTGPRLADRLAPPARRPRSPPRPPGAPAPTPRRHRPNARPGGIAPPLGRLARDDRRLLQHRPLLAPPLPGDGGARGRRPRRDRRDARLAGAPPGRPNSLAPPARRDRDRTPRARHHPRGTRPRLARRPGPARRPPRRPRDRNGDRLPGLRRRGSAPGARRGRGPRRPARRGRPRPAGGVVGVDGGASERLLASDRGAGGDGSRVRESRANRPNGGPNGGFAAPAGRPGFGGPAGIDGGADEAGLLGYLVANRGNATWMVAVASAQQASPLIIATGIPVMALGGFNGGDPAITLERFQALVHDGKVRFVAGGGQGGAFGGPGGRAWRPGSPRRFGWFGRERRPRLGGAGVRPRQRRRRPLRLRRDGLTRAKPYRSGSTGVPIPSRAARRAASTRLRTWSLPRMFVM